MFSADFSTITVFNKISIEDLVIVLAWTFHENCHYWLTWTKDSSELLWSPFVHPSVCPVSHNKGSGFLTFRPEPLWYPKRSGFLCNNGSGLVWMRINKSIFKILITFEIILINSFSNVNSDSQLHWYVLLLRYLQNIND